MKLKRWEWVVVAALAVVCAAAGLYLYLPREGETIAVISVDGNEYLRLDLAREENRVFSIQPETGKPVSFEVQDGAVRFVDVDCPDHLCEQAGWCGAPGARAVCLPNRTSLICYARGEI